MGRIDTLTAYSCNFNYMQRNNPLIDEQREAIKNGERPDFALADFLGLYSEYAQNLAIGESTDRAIMVAKEQITSFSYADNKCWHIIPSAGKQGRPVTVIKTSNKKRYDFGSDTAALYDHHIFCYSNDKNIVMIFHRQNGSGCKSVFLETANNLLKDKGIKLEMTMIVPFEDNIANVEPLKLTLQYTVNKYSSDIADNLSGACRKKKVIRDLGLNLESKENFKVRKIFDDYRLGHISKEIAFAQIKTEIGDGTEYDTAEIRLKIGNHTKSFQWNEMENLYGSYDISEDLQMLLKDNKDFKESLKQLANDYYSKIVTSGVLEDE